MNTKHLKAAISIVAAVAFAYIAAGCTALETFPQAARAGDTVALAVGSAEGMSRANTTASFESDAMPGEFYDLTPGIRGIFRLYADETSSIYDNASNAYHIVKTSGHEPWLTVMAVDLPHGLPLGTGKIHITTTATYPTIGSDINDFPINLEILPGTGVASDLLYEFGVKSSQPGDLTIPESLPHAQVIPEYPEATNWPLYGAIEMKLHVPTSASTGVRLVADNLGVYTDQGSVCSSIVTTIRT